MWLLRRALLRARGLPGPGPGPPPWSKEPALRGGLLLPALRKLSELVHLPVQLADHTVHFLGDVQLLLGLRGGCQDLFGLGFVDLHLAPDRLDLPLEVHNPPPVAPRDVGSYGLAEGPPRSPSPRSPSVGPPLGGSPGGPPSRGPPAGPRSGGPRLVPDGPAPWSHPMSSSKSHRDPVHDRGRHGVLSMLRWKGGRPSPSDPGGMLSPPPPPALATPAVLSFPLAAAHEVSDSPAIVRALPPIPDFSTLFPVIPIVFDLTSASMFHQIKSPKFLQVPLVTPYHRIQINPAGTPVGNPCNKIGTLDEYNPVNLTSAVQIIDHQMELSVPSSIHRHDHGEGNK